MVPILSSLLVGKLDCLLGFGMALLAILLEQVSPVKLHASQIPRFNVRDVRTLAETEFI